MFEQPLVEELQKTRKGWAIALSFWLQVFVVCMLILIPLVYTHALPSAQLRSMLTAPAPPPNPASKPPTEAKAQRVVVSRAFHATALVAPVVIPKRVNDIDEMPAPDVGRPSSAVPASGPTNSSIGGDLFGTGAEPPPPASPAKNAVSGPMRIGGIVAEANLIRKIQPTYPPLAKAARVQGTVEFTATISKEGNIEHLQLVRGHPLLVEAARQAVLEWKYRPTLLNGQPVEVITDILVNFRLNP
jgi:protein TonB